MNQSEADQNNDEDNQIFNFGCPPTTNFRIEFCYPVQQCATNGRYIKFNTIILYMYNVVYYKHGCMNMVVPYHMKQLLECNYTANTSNSYADLFFSPNLCVYFLIIL